MPRASGNAEVVSLRALVRYNRAVFDRFVRRLRRLPWKEVVRNREIGHRTLFDTLVHILIVQEGWLVYLVGDRVDEMADRFRGENALPTTWPQFDRFAERVWTGVDAAARQLRPSGLGRRVRAPWMPGRYTVRDAFLQVTMEEAHHLGEIIGALWQDDRAPPPMTWIEVMRRRSAPPSRRRRR